MASGSKRYKDGDQIELSLAPFANVHVLARFLEIGKHDQKVSCPNILFVFNLTSIEPFQEPIKEEGLELLCNPLRFFGTHKLPEGWRVLERSKMKFTNYHLQHLRTSWPLVLETAEDVQNAKWFHVDEYTVTSLSTLVKYDQVRHLETTWETYIDMIRFRVYLEWCKFNEIRIDQFEHAMNYSNIYVTCFDIPRYSDIPSEFVGRICPERISKYVGDRPFYKYENPTALP